MQYPLPYWWNFTVSGPTLPDFYWNVKSQEERIKKICEDLWKLIQVYKMLVDAINDHEERIQALEKKVKELEEKINDLYAKYEALKTQINILNHRVTNVENQVNNLDIRITALEKRIDDLIEDLPDQIKTIVNQILDSDEFLQKLTVLVNQIIADLLKDKMDKVPTAVEDNVATYSTGGQVKDSSKAISIDPCTYESDDTKVPTSKAVYRSIIRHITDTNMDNIPLKFGNYYLDSDVSWNTTVNSLVYYTSCIHVEAPINNQNIRVQSGWFKNPSNPTSVLMERHYNITDASWSDWQIVSHEFIQSTDELAQSVSTANPNALVYVPEEV